MRPQRPLGDASPPTNPAKRLRCPADSQIFQGRARVKLGFVAALQMVPSLVVEAQHTSGIYHIQGLWRRSCRNQMG
jgi:hypothetical protein